MRPIGKGIMAVLFVGTFLLTASQPASAAFSWYDWTDGFQVVHDGNDGLPKGQDIRNAFYAAKDDYRYFRMELAGKPNQGANGFASVYGFFIDSGSGEKYPEYSSLLGLDAGNYLDAFTKPKKSGGLKFTPDSGTLSGGTDYAFDGVKFERNGKYLDWAIPKDQLPDTFSWVAATFHSSTLTLLDKSNAVTTPIPSAAWLLGSGIIGLIGLKRRRSNKA